MAACDVDPSLNSDLLTTYIHIAEDFIGRCEKIQIPGASKLRKKCQSELKFLQTLHSKPVKVDTHLSSSNLIHFASVLQAVETLPNVTHILKPVMFPDHESILVDVIACQDHLWVKVIARKGQALHLTWAGQGQFGEKTLLHQAKDYLHLATLHPVNFKTPKLCYAFYNGVTWSMAEALSDLGVIVFGERVDVSQDVKTKLSAVYDLDQSFDQDLCFDISPKVDPNPGTCSATPLDTVVAQEACSSNAPGSTSSLTVNQHLETLQIGPTASPEDKKKTLKSSLPQVKTASVEGDLVTDCPKSKQTSPRNTQKVTSLHKYYFFDSDVLKADMCKFQIQLHDQSESLKHSDLNVLDYHPIKRVNLDVTALIALISAVTHGRCYFLFEEPVLSEQAAEERKYPVLPKLKEFLKGKELFVCQAAMTAFSTILDTLGGLEEKRRARELLINVTVVPDQPSARTQMLPLSAKIKHRSKMIFGSGDELQMITLTANSGFVRAAKNQGVLFTVHLHAARALTEEKEKKAKKIDNDTGETV